MRAPSPPRTQRSSLRSAAPRLPSTARSNRHSLIAAEMKRRPAGRLSDLPRERELFHASRLVDDFHGEAHLAALVEAEKLHFDLVAFLDDVGDLLHPAWRELADVHEAVFGAEEVHEGAEVHH